MLLPELSGLIYQICIIEVVSSHICDVTAEISVGNKIYIFEKFESQICALHFDF